MLMHIYIVLASQVFIHSLQLVNVLESSVAILASTLHFHTHKHDAQQNELWLVALNVSQKNFNISVSRDGYRNSVLNRSRG